MLSMCSLCNNRIPRLCNNTWIPRLCINTWIPRPKLAGLYFLSSTEAEQVSQQLSVAVGLASRDCMWDQHDRLSLVSLTSVPTVRQAATWIIEDVHMQICVMTMPNNTFCHTLESWKEAWLTSPLTPVTICYHVTDENETHDYGTLWQAASEMHRKAPTPLEELLSAFLTAICHVICIYSLYESFLHQIINIPYLNDKKEAISFVEWFQFCSSVYIMLPRKYV